MTLQIGKERAQRIFNGRECDLGPGDIGLLEHRHFQALGTSGVVKISQLCQIKQMHLVYVWHIDQRKQGAELDVGTGFFLGFTLGGIGGGFAVFHEACRQGPVTIAGFDGAPTQQNLHFAIDFPARNGANYQFGILIVNRATIAAHEAGTIVIGRYLQGNRMRTFRTKFHKARQFFGVLSTMH